jgi:tetratricopeptide (TPR) repeat protein
MLRLIGFFVLAALLASLLGHLPLVGVLFRSTGIFGILIVSALLAAVFTRIGERMLMARKSASQIRTLAAVDSAHNQGKIGVLYMAQGRARKALPYLERAASGEPGVADWHYRLAQARLALGQREAALADLERCTRIDDEHAYGAALRARAATLNDLGRPAEALDVLAEVERNHGPSAESAYRRGRALRALGRKAEARSAFEEALHLASQATRYQRAEAGRWALRARLARIL